MHPIKQRKSISRKSLKETKKSFRHSSPTTPKHLLKKFSNPKLDDHENETKDNSGVRLEDNLARLNE